MDQRMHNPAEHRCVPCRRGSVPLDLEAAEAWRMAVPAWTIRDGGRRIERRLHFPNFKQAFTFVQAVAEVAEAEGHHPDVTFGWGYAVLSLQTKIIGGLHENDFIMAAKFDRLLEAV
jgi:4a-hydroxytetrahydrobiopterin dehydratase